MEGVWMLTVAVLVGSCWSPLLVNAQEAPSAPTIISAVSLSPTSIDLDWTQPMEDFVISYEITFSYQGPCSGFTHTNTITVENTTLQYSLSGLQEFSNYSVSVTAVGAGNASATDVVTTLSSAPSDAPQAVRTNTSTLTYISIEWDPVDCTGQNSEISGYKVRYGPVGGTAMNVSVSGSDSLSYTVTRLAHSTNYSFEVAAESSDGVGPFSVPTTAQTNSASGPSAPIIEAVSLSPTSINLNLTQPTEELVISYEITFSYQGPCSGYTHTNTITVDGRSSTHALNGLQEFSNYAISVTAVNDARSRTATEMVTTLSAVPSGAPRVSQARATGRTTIYVRWFHVSCIRRNSEITGYTVHYASSNGVGTNTTSGSGRAYLISGLTASTKYNIMVAANSIDGTTGPFSNLITVWTSGIGLTLNGVRYFNNSLVNIYDIGNGESALLCTAAYLPCCSSANQETQWYFPNGSQVMNNQKLPLSYQRTRSFNPGAVRLNLNSEGKITGIFSCTVFDANRTLQSLYVGIYFPPSAPTIVSAVSLSPTSIDIDWTQPMEDVVISYEITFSYQGPCSGFTHTNTITVENTTMQHSLSGLQEFSNYTVRVTAVGAGNASATDVVTTLSSGGLGIMFNGKNIGNNSIMSLSDIGIGTSSLNCMTDSRNCSRRTNSSSVGVGHWYYPNGTQILNPSVLPNVSSGTSELPYYVTRDFLQVMLLRNRDGSTTGIFRCDIPDATGTMQTFYVGIYHSNMGGETPTAPTTTTLATTPHSNNAGSPIGAGAQTCTLESGSLAGVVVGACIGTASLYTVILLVVMVLCNRRNRERQTQGDRTKGAHFDTDIAMKECVAYGGVAVHSGTEERIYENPY